MPLEADLPIAYENYYTHGPTVRRAGDQGVERLVRGFLRGGYELFARVTPLHGARTHLRYVFLDGLATGNVLEVGCGAGWRLALLRERGWRVQGQEVDPAGAAFARERYELPVYLGPLEDAGWPDAHFDAVIMSHVLEHLPDPIGLLRECRRLLAANGRLVAVTPNVESFLHGWFASSWQGLDPPRHLHLFSSKTLQAAAQRAGFSQARVWTTAANALGIAGESLFIRRGGLLGRQSPRKISTQMMSFVLQLAAFGALLLRPDCGEECVLFAAP